MKCNFIEFSKRKPTTVTAVLRACERSYSYAISSSRNYIKTTFVRHQQCGFKVVRGTVESSYGKEDFFSFEDLYAILDKHTYDADFSSHLYA